MEKATQACAHKLEERIKELNCLYSISKIWQKPNFSFDDTIQEIVDLIPASWQYPEITCVQATLDGLKYRTKNYRNTEWKLASEIIVHGAYAGSLEVCYLEEKPKSNEGPFLKEERNLINAVAEQLGRIAESERMEGALRESEQKFRLMFENNSAIMFLVDPETLAIFDANRAAENFYGFARKELVTKKFHDISAMTAEEVREEIQKARLANRGFLELKHKLANGELKDVEIRSNIIDMEEDKVANFVIIHDITDRIRAEEEKKRLEAQLRQSHKMEAIGTLAGGIAHDFNNILWVINGNTELALAETPKGSPARYNLAKVEEACQRATNLVTQILSFTRQREKKPQPLKISSMVKESLKFLRSSLTTNIEIREIITAKSDLILADLTQINQVLMNLYTNAAHAMRENGGVLEVSLVNIEIDEKDTASLSGLASGKYIILTVRDTGCGIQPDCTERIFDPYFTTKEVGDGTGMGLAVAYGIIRNHGGTITVDSKPEEGAIFHVFLPVIEEHEMESETETFESLPTGNERILFVDDEEAVLEMAEQILKRLGYEVEIKQNPVEALESFKAQPDKYDLVITDQGMPNMTGENLAREIMSIRPNIPIIMCTGYSELFSAEKALAIGIKAYLIKPIVKSEFAKTLRRILDDKVTSQ